MLNLAQRRLCCVETPVSRQMKRINFAFFNYKAKLFFPLVAVLSIFVLYFFFFFALVLKIVKKKKNVLTKIIHRQSQHAERTSTVTANGKIRTVVRPTFYRNDIICYKLVSNRICGFQIRIKIRITRQRRVGGGG